MIEMKSLTKLTCSRLVEIKELLGVLNKLMQRYGVSLYPEDMDKNSDKPYRVCGPSSDYEVVQYQSLDGLNFNPEDNLFVDYQLNADSIKNEINFFFARFCFKEVNLVDCFDFTVDQWWVLPKNFDSALDNKNDLESSKRYYNFIKQIYKDFDIESIEHFPSEDYEMLPDFRLSTDRTNILVNEWGR